MENHYKNIFLDTEVKILKETDQFKVVLFPNGKVITYAKTKPHYLMEDSEWYLLYEYSSIETYEKWENNLKLMYSKNDAKLMEMLHEMFNGNTEHLSVTSIYTREMRRYAKKHNCSLEEAREIILRGLDV